MALPPYKDRNWTHYKRYVNYFSPHCQTCFDMGCGYGFFLEAWMKIRPGESQGCDFLESRISHCKKKGLNVFVHNLSEPLNQVGDRKFDAVFSNQVIEHLEDEAQLNLFREAFRILRSGGEFLVMSPCRHWEEGRNMEGHINCLTPKELATRLTDVGFANIDLQHNIPQKLPDVPAEVIEELWRNYMPDLLSQTAHAIATKP
ncbi:MAG: class I SAM-dependent methyltransferase [Okeania sp. SIO3H1]|nr:class I SAM-dependent methyltransferase [Okeania sp. SIO3H1]